MSDYNYSTFTMDDDEFAVFPTVNRAGTPAPDGELRDAADGSRVLLSDLWRRRPLVLEFGSIT